jgi:hypothetical protein
MTYRSSIVALALMALAAAPLHAQGLKATQSDRTDRAMKETNSARDPVTKGAACSCPRAGGASPIPCGACVDGLTCQATTRTLVRKTCP